MVDEAAGGFVITELWAWVSRPKTPGGDEGVLGHQVGGMLMPLVAADRRRLESLEPYVRRVVAESGQTAVLKRFHGMTIEGTLEP